MNDDLTARAQICRHLESLWEVAEDAWGDRESAVRRLQDLATAAETEPDDR